MKRKLVFLALILALVALPIAACAQEAPAPAPTQLPRSLILLNSGPLTSVGGIAFQLMANNWQQHLGITGAIDSVGGTVPAARGLRDGNGQVSMGNAIVMGQAFLGNGPFAVDNNPAKKLRALLSGYMVTYSLVVRGDRGINSVTDLPGKKILARRPSNPETEQILLTMLD